jgi:hypothetical protein
MSERYQIVISLKDSGDDTRMFKAWLAKHCEDEDGRLMNNASHHVKSAVLHCYCDPNVPIDPRYVDFDDDDSLDVKVSRVEQDTPIAVNSGIDSL